MPEGYEVKNNGLQVTVNGVLVYEAMEDVSPKIAEFALNSNRCLCRAVLGGMCEMSCGNNCGENTVCRIPSYKAIAKTFLSSLRGG